MNAEAKQDSTSLVDKHGRRVDYVRLSVTDRCDFRCVYCMSEEMTFLPRHQVLSLEEIHQVAKAFTELGVDKIRLTGGEPLVRKNVMSLVEKNRQASRSEGIAAYNQWLAAGKNGCPPQRCRG